MSREENVKVFKDTLELCETNSRLIKLIDESIAKQYVIKEEDKVETSNDHRFTSPCKVVVSSKRSLKAASVYKNKKICVHNFASATSPGGGVAHGANAQEEAICRCSTLYFPISDDSVYYKFHDAHRKMLMGGNLDSTYNDDCIYTPGIVVLKSDDDAPTLLPEDEWYSVDIITCAAPNLRERESNRMNLGGRNVSVKITDQQLEFLHKKRLRRILDVAKNESVDVMILGAFGCGAFSNNPNVVAKAMNEVIKEYQYDFDTIEFAVYCSPRDTTNYDVFSRIIEW